MRTFQQWMSEYSESHRNPLNKKIHNICVPLIMFSVVGLLWEIPGGVSLIFFSLCFYLYLNFKIFLGMVVQTALMFVICYYLSQMKILIPVSIVIFIFAWIGQFYGHKVEGKKPSFLQDLVFLLIGPLWVTKAFYDRLGIKI